MYLDAWGLRESPFGAACLTPFRTPAFEEALARLHYLVDARRRLGLLLGAPGSGKTTVLEAFARDLRRQNQQVARIAVGGLGPREFLWTLSAELGLAPARELSGFDLWRGLTDHLIEGRYQNAPTVLLLDDADEAGSSGRVEESGREVLAQVARLAEFEGARDSTLTLVLAASNERLHRLGRRVLELTELRVDLDPWQAEETEMYLRERLRQRGGEQRVFRDDAVSRLHALAHGNPRRINQLANLALVAAAGQGQGLVAPETVDGVYQELGVMQDAATAS
ncbi:MAG: AAA family ATPase [Pirellulales bacterium]